MARIINHNGRSQSISQWARARGLDQHALRYRLRTGWPIAKALDTPMRSRKRRQGPQSEMRMLLEAHNAAFVAQLRRMRKAFTDSMNRGVVANFQDTQGTGGGSDARETEKIGFS